MENTLSMIAVLLFDGPPPFGKDCHGINRARIASFTYRGGLGVQLPPLTQNALPPHSAWRRLESRRSSLDLPRDV